MKWCINFLNEAFLISHFILSGDFSFIFQIYLPSLICRIYLPWGTPFSVKGFKISSIFVFFVFNLLKTLFIRY